MENKKGTSRRQPAPNSDTQVHISKISTICLWFFVLGFIGLYLGSLHHITILSAFSLGVLVLAGLVELTINLSEGD